MFRLEIVIDISDEDRIKGDVLLDAVVGSMFEDSHRGIRIGAPPMPKEAPITPANKPEAMYLFMWFFVIGISEEVSEVVIDTFSNYC